MKFIRLAHDMNVPLDAVTQRIAILARPGAGKTYMASVMVEGMLAAGAQAVIFDPVGVWWGLRLLANGKPGFNIPVFGGNHADFPLEPGSGGTLAKFIAERRFPAVIDLSTMRKGARKQLVTDFAEEFFLAKKRATGKTPVHLVFEEAQAFVPQKPMRDEARMLGAFEDICSQGRNHGIGITLISQRPQALNKSCLNLTEMLCVLQMNGKHELDAIEAWVREKSIEAKVDGLPKLHTGQAVVWSPSWLKVFRQITVARKTTFDASATPEVGKTVKHGAVELDDKTAKEIKVALKDTIAKAEATDPRALQRRIFELEQALKKGGKSNVIQMPARAVKPETIEVEVPMFGKREQKRLDRALETIVTSKDVIDSLREDVSTVRSALLDAQVEIQALRAKKVGDLVKAERRVEAAAAAGPQDHQRAMKVAREPRQQAMRKSFGGSFNGNGSGAKLKKGARNMLIALKMFHPKGLSRERLGALAGVVPSSGTFRGYLSTLNTSGLIQEYNDGLTLTDAGQRMVADVKSVPPTSDELIPLWSGKIKKAGARRMFEYLTGIWPDGETRENVGHQSEVEPSSGTFRGYLSMLNTRDLVREKDGLLYASDDLFPERS